MRKPNPKEAEKRLRKRYSEFLKRTPTKKQLIKPQKKK